MSAVNPISRRVAFRTARKVTHIRGVPSVIFALGGSVPNYGTTTVAYNGSPAVSGGTAPYTWSISVGSLPAGLSLNTTTGAITGTPTSAGTSNFTLRVTDATSAFVQQAYSVVVAVFPSLSGTLAVPSKSVAYSSSLTLTGGHTPVSYSISSGSLPPGLSIDSSTGTISGTPSTTGPYTFTVQVTDAHGNVATSSSQTLTVHGPEIVTVQPDATWSTTGAGGGVTATSSGIVFASANNLAAGFHTFTTEDNATYEVVWTISGLTGGKGRIIVYGATTAHGGISSPDRTANGTYTETVTTSGAGSSANQIRIQATGSNGTNTFTVAAISVKKIST